MTEKGVTGRQTDRGGVSLVLHNCGHCVSCGLEARCHARRGLLEQITAQIKNLIISGELKPGDALPSMRFLAKELRISVITTKRAYEELERSGLIETVAGKGSFVAGMNADFIREEHLRIAEEHLQQAVDAAKSAGISKDELLETLGMLYDGS